MLYWGYALVGILLDNAPQISLSNGLDSNALNSPDAEDVDERREHVVVLHDGERDVLELAVDGRPYFLL